jgi:tetratricopeptide (TPR) repeat protein
MTFRDGWQTPAAALILLLGACMPSQPVVRPEKEHFSGLSYGKAVERYREDVRQRYEKRDVSYVLALLNYSLVNLYAGERDSARRGFTASYKVDDGQVDEAAKFYQWLQVDARTVYKLAKRERLLAHLYLGLCYLFDDNMEESLVEFKRLRMKDQEASYLPVAGFYMGLLYEKLGKYDDALIEYRNIDADFAGLEELIARAEALQGRTYHSAPDSVDVVLHVDHQFWPSTGRTVVHADDNRIAALPPFVDQFEVRLSEAELSRKAAQEAGARAARESIRCCGSLLAQRYLGNNGEVVADLAADIALGDESMNKETRFWKYAPVALSVQRFSVPLTTAEMKLVFFGRDGGQLGSAAFALDGTDPRVHHAVDTYFVVAGLAREFYVY